MGDFRHSRLGDLVEVAMMGFPFCAFKGVVGLLLVREGPAPLGYALLALAATDLLLNGANLLGLVLLRRRVASPCTLSALSQRWRPLPHSSRERLRDFGNALDVALSFGLVAAMVGFSRVATLPPAHVDAWNLAVVLNVLGASAVRLGAFVGEPPKAGQG